MFLLMALLAVGWMANFGEPKVHQMTSLTRRLRPPSHSPQPKEALYSLVVILHRGISRMLREERDNLSKEDLSNLLDLKGYMELIVCRYESSKTENTQDGRSRAKMMTEAFNHPITVVNSLNRNQKNQREVKDMRITC